MRDLVTPAQTIPAPLSYIMTPDTTQSTQPNWPLLAGVRFVLALIVMLTHAGGLNDPHALGLNFYMRYLSAMVAVLAFLVISGYSICHSITQNPDNFYIRRWNRLAPTYYSSLLLAFVVYAAYHGEVDNGTISQMLPTPRQVLVSLVGMGGVLDAPIPILAPAWSLGVEICLYAFAPLLRRISIQWIYAAMAVSYVVFANTCFVWYAATPGLTAVIALSWFWLAGWCLYLKRDSHNEKWAIALAATCGGLTMNGPAFVLQWVPMALAIAAICWGGEFHLSARVSGVLSRLGDISFPLYLAHSVFFYAIPGLGHLMGLSLPIPVTLVLTVLASWGLLILLDWRDNIRSRQSSRTLNQVSQTVFREQIVLHLRNLS